MPQSIALPEAILTRFRSVGFERLERIEAAWLALTHGGAVPGGEEEMYRDLHTLKGDARVVGFADIGILCQRLEDLLAAARARNYRVHEDVDIVVNMGLQFIGMLLRKKAGAPRGGIDLDGFLKQLEDVLAEWLRRSSETPAQAIAGPVHIRVNEPSDRVSAGSRQRLSTVATSIYLEHLRVGNGASRSRLRDIWRVLAREIAMLDAAPLAPILERHAVAATELANELKKPVTVVGDAKGATVAVEALEAINTAVLHAVRNAVDHGIESPNARAARGKPPVGTVSVRAAGFDSWLEVVVQDDGGGIDLERVRRRAIERRLLAANESNVGDARLLELLFQPGFSTRENVTDVSGRGIGLDAVRTAIARVGGRVDLRSELGKGTTLTIRVPQARRTIDVCTFRGVTTNVLFAVPTTWSVVVGPDAPCASVDFAEALALPPVGAPATARVLQLRRERMTISLAAGSVPEPASAIRMCPTPPEEPAEVVDLGRTEAILLRPEVFLTQPHAR